jgi:hypothetical protein
MLDQEFLLEKSLPKMQKPGVEQELRIVEATQHQQTHPV